MGLKNHLSGRGGITGASTLKVHGVLRLTPIFRRCAARHWIAGGREGPQKTLRSSPEAKVHGVHAADPRPAEAPPAPLVDDTNLFPPSPPLRSQHTSSPTTSQLTCRSIRQRSKMAGTLTLKLTNRCKWPEHRQIPLHRVLTCSPCSAQATHQEAPGLARGRPRDHR